MKPWPVQLNTTMVYSKELKKDTQKYPSPAESFFVYVATQWGSIVLPSLSHIQKKDKLIVKNK